jgi:spore coat protein U-like protein
MSSALVLLVISSVRPKAADLTSSLDVSLTVVAGCSGLSAGPLNFGSVAQGGGTVNTTSTISVTCGSGVPYSIHAGPGHVETFGGRQMWLNNTDSSKSAGYFLFRDSSHASMWSDLVQDPLAGPFTGTGTGSQQSFTVYASAQSGPVPGVYQDTVVVTLSF